MRVLFAASEVTPIIKIGGLGDVAGSLPKALELIGVNVDVIVPFFSTANESVAKIVKMLDLVVPFANQTHTVGVYRTKLPLSNVDVFLLKNAYFITGGKAAFNNTPTETAMFSFFDRCVVEFVKAEFNTYDLVHCNDWHTGMVTHILEDEFKTNRPSTLFTVHNLAYQGVAPLTINRDLDLEPEEHSLLEWDIADGDINFMLQGLGSSDFINTVSPTYAEEILQAQPKNQIYDVIFHRAGRFVGILNGIDYSQFKSDLTSATVASIKPKNKLELQKELGLAIDPHAPIFSFVSRLDPGQKGLDILYDSLHKLIEANGQFVLLGTGDKNWETKFNAFGLTAGLAGKVSIKTIFDTALANRLYAGSDFLLIPSKYEPCGLTQMIGMHYGTLPIAHDVGGLSDSIIDGVDGFKFTAYSSDALQEAILRGIKTYENTQKYEKMVHNALAKDFSWDKSAKEYKKLYERILSARM